MDRTPSRPVPKTLETGRPKISLDRTQPKCENVGNPDMPGWNQVEGGGENICESNFDKSTSNCTALFHDSIFDMAYHHISCVGCNIIIGIKVEIIEKKDTEHEVAVTCTSIADSVASVAASDIDTSTALKGKDENSDPLKKGQAGKANPQGKNTTMQDKTPLQEPLTEVPVDDTSTIDPTEVEAPATLMRDANTCVSVQNDIQAKAPHIKMFHP